MTVHFHEVGRAKLTWSEEVEHFSDYVLLRCIQKRGALLSREVSLHWNETGNAAAVVVGGFRRVGWLTVEGGLRV